MKASGGFSARRVLELLRKEFLQIRRDPRLLRVIFVAPVIQLVVFGYAVSTDVRDTPVFVVDLDQTRASRELITAFTAAGYFRVIGQSERPADLAAALASGRATLGLEIPRGMAADLAAGHARVQLLLDGTNSNIATIARGYAERIVQSHAQRYRADAAGGPAAARAGAGIQLRERAWYNPTLESRNYNVPAVVGTIMMLISLLLTSLAIVREREIGTLEQLMVTPLRPGELIAGKLLPFAIIALVDLVVITVLALLWFRVPFAGSFPLLLLASVFYLLAALGLGLLVSTVSSTQQEAFLATFLIFMPTILLSGFMFPVSSMPAFFQWLTLLNPMRHYLEIVRGIFLKGSGLGLLWPQFLALVGMGVGVLWLATRRFRRLTG
jgi:ABC-2 type transport system permease protein